MKNKDEFLENDIKNRTCYYFNYTMEIIDRDILFDERKYEKN